MFIFHKNPLKIKHHQSLTKNFKNYASYESDLPVRASQDYFSIYRFRDSLFIDKLTEYNIRRSFGEIFDTLIFFEYILNGARHFKHTS